jgi:hypothetical protein
VTDPNESWEVKGRDSIRAGKVTANDGGQRYDWYQHNGSVADAAQWNEQKEIWETGTILDVKEWGDWIVIMADCTKAYSSQKLETFTRQIVFQRPGTFVIVDKVRVKDPAFKTIWNLQAMKRPTKVTDDSGNDLGLWTWSNGNGRLFLQTLLPEKVNVELYSGEKLYMIDGVNYPPQRDTGPAPECRMEISPAEAKTDYLFVHVLRATDAGVEMVPLAEVDVSENQVRVSIDAEWTISLGVL